MSKASILTSIIGQTTHKTTLSYALSEAGIESQSDKHKRKIVERYQNKDLLFIDHKLWSCVLENNVKNGTIYKDRHIFISEEGVLTSKKKIQKIKFPDQIYDKPAQLEFKWNSSESIWEVKNLITHSKAQSLVDLMYMSNVTIVDDNLTSILKTVKEELSYDKTIDLMSTIMEDLVRSSNKDSCEDLGVKFDNTKYEKIVKLKTEFGELLESLQKTLRGTI